MPRLSWRFTSRISRSGFGSFAVASIFGRLNILFDRAKGLDHEHGVMRHDRAAAFADDRGMRDPLGVADVHDVINDVVAYSWSE